MAKRASGVLLHPTSLPGDFGIGDLGTGATWFLDWLHDAGQVVWQVLPLGPVGQGGSPYDAQSSYAGNPALIDPRALQRWGLITGDKLATAATGWSAEADLDRALQTRLELLRRAWVELRGRGDSDPFKEQLVGWIRSPPQSTWLDSWSLYAALKQHHGGQSWSQWPTPLRQRHPEAVEEAKGQLADQVAYQSFIQYVFFRQWSELKSQARHRGISLLGDLPFYVALDSCEVWMQPELFDLDPSGRPRSVAGVPPDYFSETGQRWGNPTYLWQRHAEQGFRWWIDRLQHQLSLVDRLRLDHFRGFAGFWKIPGDRETAAEGAWEPGPGAALFDAVGEALGGLPFVAEDLGLITDDVERLRAQLGLPGMKVLQFAFDSADSPHLVHNLTPDTVVYTGTHDNDTARGWFDSLASDMQNRVLRYCGGSPESAHWELLRTAETSVAELVMLPAQDIAGLDGSHRMNTPGTATGNWRWRLPPDCLTTELARDLRKLTAIAGRLAPTDA